MARSLSMLYAKNPKGSALDARSDLGYGRSSLKFTKPRQQASAYPYSMTDEQEEESEKIDDVEIDDVSLDFAAKVHRYLPVTDFYASAGTDPFYYAGAATKLSEELGKYVVSAGGIGMTLPADVGSSVGHGYRTNIRPTGTRRGWSSAPRSFEETPPKYRLEDFLGEDDSIIRKFVRSILYKDKAANVR